MASGSTPREVYVFGLLVIYALFGLLYLASLQTFTNIGTSTGCTNNSLEKPNYTGEGLGEETTGLFQNVFRKIDCAPDWVNIIFVVFTGLIVALIIMALLHG